MTTSLSRRHFLTSSVGAGLSLSSLSALAAESKKRPNIILVMADDLGYECIGANGGTSYKTPVLDELAAQGMRFEHCYSQPLCTPSRVKLMTGIYNIKNYVCFGLLDKDQTTFAQLLKKSGYATCIAGKWQLRGGFEGPHHFGFDEYCLWQLTRLTSRYPNPGLEVNGKEVDFKKGGYGPDVMGDFACEFIKKNKDKPFLVYYPMILTHCPFEPTPQSADWDPKSKGSPDYKGKAKYFGDMVASMDKQVGKLVKQLEDLGLRENTLILFTGDNGTDQPIVTMMGDKKVAGGKGKMTDAGTRVPLIANWPGVIPEGKVTDTLVDFSDFLPTLCEISNTQVPETLDIDGQSFWPQLQGKEGTPRDWIYCWYSRGGGPKGKNWVRNQRYKLYKEGRFFDVSQDELEKTPLVENRLSAEEKQIKSKLQAVLDKYANARPKRLFKPTKLGPIKKG